MPTVSQAQVLSLAAGVRDALDGFQFRVERDVLAETLPLVGNGLTAAAAAGQAALLATEDLAAALGDALDALAGAASQTDAAMQSALNAAAAGFAGTVIEVTVCGGVVQLGVASQEAASYLQELAADLGLAGLGALADGAAEVEAIFDYDLHFGTDASGFFVDATTVEEITLSLAVDQAEFGPGFSISGQAFDALDAGSQFSATIGLDLQAAGGRLTAGQVSTATLDARPDGVAAFAIGLASADQGDMTPPISAEFGVDWTFANAVVDPGDTNASFGSLPSDSFDAVTIDLGGFMQDFIAPLITQIDKLLDPIRLIRCWPGKSGQSCG